MSRFRKRASLDCVRVWARRLGVENVPCRVVGDTHQSVIGGILEIIAVRSSSREAAELCAFDHVGLAATDRGRC